MGYRSNCRIVPNFKLTYNELQGTAHLVAYKEKKWKHDLYSPIDHLKQKRIPWLDFNIVSFEALPLWPLAVLDRLQFYPRVPPWGLGANRAHW